MSDETSAPPSVELLARHGITVTDAAEQHRLEVLRTGASRNLDLIAAGPAAAMPWPLDVVKGLER